MIKLSLYLAKLVYREPCSVQREILNRLQKKRGAWDATNSELLEIYEHLDALVKKRSGMGGLSLSQFATLLKHPTSALNFIQGRKVPINDLEKFRTDLASSTKK